MKKSQEQSSFVATLPVMETERLILREWSLKDAPEVDTHFSDEDVVKMTGSKPFPYLPNTAYGSIATRHGRYLRGMCYDFAIVDPTTKAIIGGCGVFKRTPDAPFELGYWIGKAYWGKGIASEAAKCVMDWAKQALNPDMIVAGHFADNPASGRILDKLGFGRVGGIDETIPMYSLARGTTAPGYTYIWPAQKAAITPLSALH
ncbi:GNAT family N-acetyltransferase [Hirschia baltica]|uniref:GCN5-related N-acetyltransferase n=1 Tax=Hirschia baltica (strain ATCC 49814 / DSM 5838 / IFAM 1418) TaxID=582402 RepID=C6XL40_HIRBI|nr:GNAT family N-acetyltransferase [Hirschia baltica]ACT57869.1 GCN5-related N-acetyltransferase [Hirschia baltica ATCC 49814]